MHSTGHGSREEPIVFVSAVKADIRSQKATADAQSDPLSHRGPAALEPKTCFLANWKNNHTDRLDLS